MFSTTRQSICQEKEGSQWKLLFVDIVNSIAENFYQCPMQFFQCLMQMQLCYAINSETKACFISLIHSCVILDEVKLYDKDICF
jgi:hypothetical protein